MNPEKAAGLSPELQTALQPLLAAIESVNEPVGEYNHEGEARVFYYSSHAKTSCDPVSTGARWKIDHVITDFRSIRNE
jgi:hypothetical protein